MSYQTYDEDQWAERQDASFRGVKFGFVSSKGKAGRRALAHEYPKREQGWAEDNGKILNNETIIAELVGVDAQTEFQQLLNALNVAGPGELVHPYWGIQQIQIGNVDYDLDNNQRYYAQLSFVAYTVGENQAAKHQSDTSQKTAAAASAANASNEASFSANMSDLNAEQTLTLGDSIDDALKDLDNFTASLPSLPSELGEWKDRLESTIASVSRLLAYPGELAREFTNLITDIKELTTTLPESLNVYQQVVQKWDGLIAEASPNKSSTTTQQPDDIDDSDEMTQQADASSTLAQQLTLKTTRESYIFTRNSAVIAKTTALASGEFDNSEQASEVATQLNEQLQTLASTAVEASDSQGWRDFRTLRVAVSDDFALRLQKLPQVKVVRPTQTIPVALLAYQQTGDTANREQIIAQNQLSRPSFLTPDFEIKVILETEDVDG